MTITLDKNYTTKDGREVRIYCTDGGGDYPVHGAWRHEDGRWIPENWTSHGVRMKHEPGKCDLIEVRPRVKLSIWVNVYRKGSYSTYPSEAAAVAHVSCHPCGFYRLTAHRIDIDEPEDAR